MDLSKISKTRRRLRKLLRGEIRVNVLVKWFYDLLRSRDNALWAVPSRVLTHLYPQPTSSFLLRYFLETRIGRKSLLSLLEELLREKETSRSRKHMVSIRQQLDFFAPRFAPSVRVKAECLFCQVFRNESALIALWDDPNFLQELDSSTAITLRQQSLDTLYALGAIGETKKLAKTTKRFLDGMLSRLPGIWNEPAHFSAVGHLSLLHYLLGLVDSGLIRPDTVRLVRGVHLEANKPYADWLHSRAIAIGITVLSPDEVSGPLESGLDLWPFDEGYLYALDEQHRAVQALATSNSLRDDSLLSITEVGKNVLREIGWDSTKPTVTFHIRNNQGSNRALRNSEPGKYFLSAHRLVLEGYNVVLLGADFENGSAHSPAGSMTLQGLSKESLEYANIALWQLSDFYVGNLSGGTNPPSAFQTPILWTDTCPMNHWRPPGAQDLFLPKIVFSKNLTRPLRFEEIMSEEHCWSQTEDPHLFLRAGYRIQEVSSDEIDAAVSEMQASREFQTPNPTPAQSSVASIYKRHNLEFGGFVADTFLGSHPDLLSS